MSTLINWIWSLIMALFGKKTVEETTIVEMKTSASILSIADARRKRNKRQRVARRDSRREARGLSRMG